MGTWNDAGGKLGAGAGRGRGAGEHPQHQGLKEALPELWVEADGEHVDAVLRATAVETTVLA
jgi:hypothetical protein